MTEYSDSDRPEDQPPKHQHGDSDPPEDQPPKHQYGDSIEVRPLDEDEHPELRKKIRDNLTSEVRIGDGFVHLRPTVTAVSLFAGAITVMAAGIIGAPFAAIGGACGLISFGSILLGLEEKRVPIPTSWFKSFFKKPPKDETKNEN